MVVMALGLGVIIRNDFRAGDDAETFIRSTIDRLIPYFPEYKIVGGDEIIHFLSKECDSSCPFSLALACGFWYVINGSCFYHIFHPRDYKLKLETYDLARALGQDEIWYTDEYTLDRVSIEYTFEDFIEHAKQCDLVEYFEGIKDEYGTTFFHEKLKAHPSIIQKFRMLIIGDETPVVLAAERYGVDFRSIGREGHLKYYQFEIEDDGFNWHPFLRDVYRRECVFSIWQWDGE